MDPISKLFLPPRALSNCMFAAVYRNTLEAKLCASDRVNHFPASPLVSVTLVSKGELHLLQPAADLTTALQTRPLPRFTLMAPQDTPTTSWAKDGIEAITLGIYPDAWRSLGGDTAYSRIPSCFVAALEHLSAAADQNAGWQAVCESLAPQWAQNRSETWRRNSGISDWAKGLASRLALSGTGRGLRSVERRMQRYTGQTRQALEFFSAFEALQATAHQNFGMPLAEIAHEAGYSDQSHMGRAVRRATGFSPARLNRAIQTEEAFWCYRLLGERY